MNTETLKKLAEAMRYDSKVVATEFLVSECFYQPKGKDDWWSARRFNPENNAELREEILLWLLKKDWDLSIDYDYEDGGGFVFIQESEFDAVTGKGKDYTAALLNAAEKEINQ